MKNTIYKWTAGCKSNPDRHVCAFRVEVSTLNPILAGSIQTKSYENVFSVKIMESSGAEYSYLHLVFIDDHVVEKVINISTLINFSIESYRLEEEVLF